MSHDSVASSSAVVEEFLKAMRPKLKRVLTTAHVPVEDAEDVLQQALVVLVEKWDKIRDHESWLLGTLRRHCFMYFRNHRRQLHSSLDATLLECLSQPVAPAQERSDLRSDLRRMVQRLPPKCRSLLELRYQLGYEPDEVAAKLGYRGSSIGKITHRCLEALAREMVGATAPAAPPSSAAAWRPSAHSPPEEVARSAHPSPPEPAAPLPVAQRVYRPQRLESRHQLAPPAAVLAGADLPGEPPSRAPAEVRHLPRQLPGASGPLGQARWPRGNGDSEDY
jgi:RNA polymerase sigma factor (sigma-70 family)